MYHSNWPSSSHPALWTATQQRWHTPIHAQRRPPRTMTGYYLWVRMIFVSLMTISCHVAKEQQYHQHGIDAVEVQLGLSNLLPSRSNFKINQRASRYEKDKIYLFGENKEDVLNRTMKCVCAFQVNKININSMFLLNIITDNKVSYHWAWWQ